MSKWKWQKKITDLKNEIPNIRTQHWYVHMYIFGHYSPLRLQPSFPQHLCCVCEGNEQMVGPNV